VYRGSVNGVSSPTTEKHSQILPPSAAVRLSKQNLRFSRIQQDRLSCPGRFSRRASTVGWSSFQGLQFSTNGRNLSTERVFVKVCREAKSTMQTSGRKSALVIRSKLMGFRSQSEMGVPEGYGCAAPNSLPQDKASHPQGNSLAMRCHGDSMIGIARGAAAEKRSGRPQHHCLVYGLKEEAAAHPASLPGLVPWGKLLAIAPLGGGEGRSC
jgi:hypothetical protein